MNIICVSTAVWGPPSQDTCDGVTKDNLLVIETFKYVNFLKRRPFPRDDWNEICDSGGFGVDFS